MDTLEVLDEQRLDAMMASVRESVETTFAMLTGASPRLAPSQCGDTDLIAIICFVGDHPPWSLVLSMPRATAESMAPRFAGFDIGFDSADMADAIGEVVNIIAGDLVARLESIDMHSQMSVPSIARGKGLDLVLPDCREAAELYFQSEDGPYCFRVATRRGGASPRHICSQCGR